MRSHSNFEVKKPMGEPVVEYVSQSDKDDSEEPDEAGDGDGEEECEEDPEEELLEDQEVGSKNKDPEEELEAGQEVGSEDEDPEEELEDPEEELEEDQEVGSEENQEVGSEEDQEVGFEEEEEQEEESSVEPSEEPTEEPSESVSPDEGASKEMSSHGEIDENDHPSGSKDNCLTENKRSLDATCHSDLFQVNQKKFRQEEAVKAEADVAKQQEHTGSSGKRRRSRWDENDGKTEGIEKRRKTRWASEVSDLKMLGPIQLPDFVKGLVASDVDPKIQKLKLRLAELNSKLVSSELQDSRPEEERSPSPEPEYNNLGIRITRVERLRALRQKLVAERRRVISKLIKKNPTFHAPPDYKLPKLFKKLYVPVKEYPTYNFVGLIMGPRGNTQKKLQQETGAKVLLRGKGSAKGPDKTVDKSDNDDLHVLIEADDQKSLDAAVEMVGKLLIPVDEDMNDHKRAQLEELAKLKGTYKDHNVCSVCKQAGHKDYACPHQQSTFKMVITCAKCGSFSHTSSSCPSLTLNTKGKPNRETSDADLYVGYLPQGVDENRLRELFCPFGKITEVKVVMDRNTGLSKGYGFVKFESPVDAAMAVTHMHGLKLEGKMLAVRVAGRPPAPGALSHLPMHPGPPTVISANVPSHLRHLPMHPGPPAVISANVPSHLSLLPMHRGPPAVISASVPSHLSHLPMHPGPPAVISANVPSHLRHLPMYHGPTAAISGNALNLKALPEPPGYMLPEAQSSFKIKEGLGVPSSSTSLGHFNQIVESKAMDVLPPIVSSHAGSQLARSFDSYYRYPNQVPFSSPGLTSQFPGDQVYPAGSQLLSYSSTPLLKPSPPPYHFSYTSGNT